MNVVLTIAGTDPSGAAGVQADLHVIRDHQMHGVSVITAVLAQNTQGVREVQPMSSALVAAQLDAVLADFDVTAVKVGLVPTDELVRLIAARVGHLPLVWDPVLSSGDGLTPLFDGSPDTLLDVLAHVDVFTPNIPEAGLLLRRAVVSRAAAHRAATDLPCAGVLLKAGHLPHAGRIADIWADPAGSRDLAEFDAVSDDVRGTGCHLSTAIACAIASGLDVVAAVELARSYLNELLLNRASRLGRGRRMIHHAAETEDDGGRSGVAHLVEETCALARLLADAASGLGLEVVNDLVLNEVMLSAGNDIETAALYQHLYERGEIACSLATWKGRRLICLSVSSHRTSRADVEAVTDALREAMSRGQ